MNKLLRFTFVVLSFTAHAQPLPISPPIYNPANEQSYILLDSSSWTEAEAAAVLLGGHLVTINDADEQTFIWDTLKSYGGIERALWIGLNDTASIGTFVWTSGEPLIYTNWAVGEPNVCPIYEDYVHIFPLSDYRFSYWNNILNSGAGGCGGGWHINGVVEMKAPSAEFSSSDSTVCEKFCVDFFDSSANNPTSWQWNFEGGNPPSSADQYPAGICYDNPGVFDVTLITANAAGYDTLLLTDFITVYTNPFAPVITQNGNALICTVADSYQWYLNTVLIPGATDQTYTITESGLYTVVIENENGCEAQTDFDASWIGIEDMSANFSFNIFPNPASDQITFLISDFACPDFLGEISKWQIVNLIGQQILSSEIKINGEKSVSANIESLPAGIYKVMVIGKEGMRQASFVKE